MQDAAQGFRTSSKSIVGTVTSWPSSLHIAASWDAELAEEWGQALGAEHRSKGANVILGPSVNVHRVPRGGRSRAKQELDIITRTRTNRGLFARARRCAPPHMRVTGRNAEYISGESPHLGSVMASSYVRGVQTQGVVAVVKHFALNNQETNRNGVNSVCDERTMFEVYYPPFKGERESKEITT